MEPSRRTAEPSRRNRLSRDRTGIAAAVCVARSNQKQWQRRASRESSGSSGDAGSGVNSQRWWRRRRRPVAAVDSSCDLMKWQRRRRLAAVDSATRGDDPIDEVMDDDSNESRARWRRVAWRKGMHRVKKNQRPRCKCNISNDC
jgi:hypothetical protein